MTDPPLFPLADAGGDGTPEEPLGTLTVEDDLSTGSDEAGAGSGSGSSPAAQADDYQADEAHDWTGGPTP